MHPGVISFQRIPWGAWSSAVLTQTIALLGVQNLLDKQDGETHKWEDKAQCWNWAWEAHTNITWTTRKGNRQTPCHPAEAGTRTEHQSPLWLCWLWIASVNYLTFLGSGYEMLSSRESAFLQARQAAGCEGRQNSPASLGMCPCCPSEK